MQAKALEAQDDAQHPDEDDHHPQPLPRDADLPTVSDTTLAFFAGGALFVTAVALIVLLD